MEYSNISEFLSKKINNDGIVNFKIVPTTKNGSKKSNIKNEDNSSMNGSVGEESTNKIDLIFSILNRLEDKINNIEKKIDNDIQPNNIRNQSNGITNTQSNIMTGQLEYVMKEIKPQAFDDVDDSVLKSHLRKRRMESDGKLIYKIYFENLPRNLFPIRIVRKSSIEYWLNGKWNEDMDGEYIRETLSKNLIASYVKVNKFSPDLVGSHESDFMKNQTYILSLKDKKYQASLWDYLKKNYLY